MKRQHLTYAEEYNAFIISDAQINREETQFITLPAEAYKKLQVEEPKTSAPTVGLLLGRDGNAYSAGYNYVLALAKTGANIRFITYDVPSCQMVGCDALVLPGGAFKSSEQFYVDPQREEGLTDRFWTYVELIRYATNVHKPILGICAGAQLVGAYLGMKMFRDKSYIYSDVEHKTSDPQAHPVFLKNAEFQKLLGEPNLVVNSRHSEFMTPAGGKTELKVYAEAPDGIPEAWGSWDKRILCIQWHPEDLVAAGDEKQQKIFDWLFDEAKAYQNRKY